MPILLLFLLKALYFRWAWKLYSFPMSLIISIILLGILCYVSFRIITSDKITYRKKIVRTSTLIVIFYFFFFLPYRVGYEIQKLLSSGYVVAEFIQKYKEQNGFYPQDPNIIGIQNNQIKYKYDDGSMNYFNREESFNLTIESDFLYPVSLYYSDKQKTFKWNDDIGF